jgi:hypothetical protein
MQNVVAVVDGSLLTMASRSLPGYICLPEQVKAASAGGVCHSTSITAAMTAQAMKPAKTVAVARFGRWIARGILLPLLYVFGRPAVSERPVTLCPVRSASVLRSVFICLGSSLFRLPS